MTDRLDIDKLASGQTLLIDKPKNWTSFDVIRKLQGVAKYKKIGHAGTLDPLATGLLILCTGKHTKKINEFQDWEKEYIATFKLGATTKSYDAEFEEEEIKDASGVALEQIEKAIKEKFLGKIEQVPPAFSAVKVKGQRAYKLARKGKKVEIKSREVEIKSFEVVKYCHSEQSEESFTKKTNPSILRRSPLIKGEKNVYQAKIVCSKGTYIRSLVHDLGQELGVGAYLTDLRRTRIGDFKVADAWELNNLIENSTT